VINPAVLKSTFPAGDSSWFPFSPSRTISISPFGPQSAHCTLSSSSRGVPPDDGTLAKVPIVSHAILCALSKTASSPERETDKGIALEATVG